MNKSKFKWPVFDTLSQCSSATSISVTTLKKAKDEGCRAFRNNRIYFADLIEWLAASRKSNTGHLDLEQEQARLTKEKADALAEKRMKESNERDFMTEVESMLNEQLVLPCRAWLTSAPSSLAPRCNPTAPEVARKILEDAFHKEFFPMLRTKFNRPKTK